MVWSVGAILAIARLSMYGMEHRGDPCDRPALNVIVQLEQKA